MSRFYQRKDLFDENLDIQYKYTQASSSIPPPKFYPPDIAKNWKEKAQDALHSFQKAKSSNPEDLFDASNNPVIRALLSLVGVVTDERELATLQDEILGLIYVSESQKQILKHGKQKGKKWQNKRNARPLPSKKLGMYHEDMYTQLPGPMPATVTRCNMYRFDCYTYWVAEKSDGIRYMLFFAKSKVYLIDRRFQFYRIKHTFYQSQLCTPQKASLFDGELILSEGALMFVAFDCVAYKGSSMSSDFTSRRLHCIEKFMKEWEEKRIEYEEKQYNNSNSYDNEQKINPDLKIESDPIPILLFAKHHYKAETGLSHLLNNISLTEEGEYIYTERDEVNNRVLRQSHNDGLIFTPEESNYLMDSDQGILMKWKFLEKNTIDLKVKSPYFFRGKLLAYASGINGIDLLFTETVLTVKERKRFDNFKHQMSKVALNQYGNSFIDSFIVEFGWDFDTKRWMPLQVRTDKNRANHITVCTDNLTVMMDNVTQEELIAKCMRTNDHNSSPSSSSSLNKPLYSSSSSFSTEMPIRTQPHSYPPPPPSHYYKNDQK